MGLIRYLVVLLFVSSIATEVVFSPNTLQKRFTIPSLEIRNTSVKLTSTSFDEFSWEVVQLNGECAPITVSPPIGSGYTGTTVDISVNTALLKAGLNSCTISALCSTTNSQNVTAQNIADLEFSFEVITEYCYDKPSYFCETSRGTFSHCNRTSGLCDCNTDYYGESCQRQCSDSWFDNQCGDHGHCNTAPDLSFQECVCDDHYYPVSSQLSESNCRVFCDPALNCTGNARCSDQGRCECEEGYYGLNCTAYCTVEKCSFAGKCSADGTCQCNVGRYGDRCQYITCPYCVRGTCNNGTGTCECPAGYYGPHCDKHCDATTCGAHGHCGTDGCVCDTNWYGTACETFCDSTKCNHGTCAEDGKSCVCQQPWLGPHCDKDCTCSHHGECTDDYKCICDANYYGPSCEVLCVDEITCGFNGRCNRETGKCICESGYYGPMCMTYCTGGLTCNGHGICDSQGQCKCDTGYAGYSCSYQYSTPSTTTTSPAVSPSSSAPSLTEFAIVLAIVSGVAILGAVVVVVRCVKQRRAHSYEVVLNN